MQKEQLMQKNEWGTTEYHNKWRFLLSRKSVRKKDLKEKLIKQQRTLQKPKSEMFFFLLTISRMISKYPSLHYFDYAHEISIAF